MRPGRGTYCGSVNYEAGTDWGTWMLGLRESGAEVVMM